MRADGASSRVRQLMAPDPAQPKTYIAIQKWVETEEQHCGLFPLFSIHTQAYRFFVAGPTLKDRNL